MRVSVHDVACKWRYAPFVMLILNKYLVNCFATVRKWQFKRIAKNDVKDHSMLSEMSWFDFGVVHCS